MSEITPYANVTATFITPRAAELAFVGGYMLQPNTVAIDAIADVVGQHHDSFGLPKIDGRRITASELTIILRGGAPSFAPHAWDGAWDTTTPLSTYYSIDQLGQSSIKDMQATQKSAIQDLQRPAVELTITDFSKPIGVILAAKLVDATPTHFERGLRTATTMMSGSPFTAAKRVKAMNGVEDKRLEPFIVTRKPGYILHNFV